MVQWLRIGPPMQGTQVQSLCLGRFHMLQGTEAHEPQLLKPMHVSTGLHNKRIPRNEKTTHRKKSVAPARHN